MAGVADTVMLERGPWGMAKSLLRYRKPARYIQALSELTPSQMQSTSLAPESIVNSIRQFFKSVWICCFSEASILSKYMLTLCFAFATMTLLEPKRCLPRQWLSLEPKWRLGKLVFGKRKAEHFYACNHCGLDRRLDDAVVGILSSVDGNGETDNAYLGVEESSPLDLKGLEVSNLQVGNQKSFGDAAQHVMQCGKGGLAIYASSGTFCLAATNTAAASLNAAIKRANTGPDFTFHSVDERKDGNKLINAVFIANKVWR